MQKTARGTCGLQVQRPEKQQAVVEVSQNQRTQEYIKFFFAV